MNSPTALSTLDKIRFWTTTSDISVSFTVISP